MSLELGGRNKSVKYLNLTKVGKESVNDKGAAETCSVTYRTFNNPFLENQADHLCAVTRFSVPLTEIPIIDTQTFEVWRFRTNEFRGYMRLEREENHEFQYPEEEKRPELGDASVQEQQFYLQQYLTDHVEYNVENLVSTITIPASFTIYQFMENIVYQIGHTTHLVYYTKDHEGNTPESLKNNLTGDPDFPRTTYLDERIKMTLTPDLRFRIEITNDGYAYEWYVKLSKGMFNMLQFVESPVLSVPATEDNDELGQRWRLINRRIMGFPNDTLSGKVLTGDSGIQLSTFRSKSNQRGSLADGVTNGTSYDRAFEYKTQYKTTWAKHTANMSCADMNRIREVVFSSDIFVLSEGNAENAYKRFLCDYQVFNPTKITYNLHDMTDDDPYSIVNQNHQGYKQRFLGDQTSFSETLPGHLIYQNDNPSAGRWQELITASPLWEMEVQAMAKVWDYQKSEYRFEKIPIPAGQQFTVKLIFVSKDNQVVTVAEKPDKYHS